MSEDSKRRQDMKAQSRDRNGVALPDGWAVYHDGELVFSVDDGKRDTIGPGITAAIMEPGADTPAEVAAAITGWLGNAEAEIRAGKERLTRRDARVIQLLHCAWDLAENYLTGGASSPGIPGGRIIRGPQGGVTSYACAGWAWAEDRHVIPAGAGGPSRSAARARLLELGLDGWRADRALDFAYALGVARQVPVAQDGGDQVAAVTCTQDETGVTYTVTAVTTAEET